MLKLAISTDQPGEALSALAAVRRTLAAVDLDLHDVAIGLQAPTAIDESDWRSLARAVDLRRDLLTEKERRFITVILAYRNEPSAKQRAWLTAIANRIGVH